MRKINSSRTFHCFWFASPCLESVTSPSVRMWAVNLFKYFIFSANTNSHIMHATASVIMDKLLELLANFFLLALGLTAIFQSGILSTNGISSWLSLGGLVILCMWPPIHIILLYKQKVSRSLLVLRSISIHQKGFKGGAFHRRLRTSGGRVLSPAFVVIVIRYRSYLFAQAVGMVSEFALITYFLHIQLPFWQTVSAWTAGWLCTSRSTCRAGWARSKPARYSRLALFGVSATSAISVTLLMRGPRYFDWRNWFAACGESWISEE